MADNNVNITLTAKDKATPEIKAVYTEISNINKQIRAEDQEWKKLSLTIDKNRDAARYLTEQKAHLERQMGNLKSKAETLSAAIERSKDAKGEDTRETEKIRSRLSDLELQQVKTKKELDSASKALEANASHVKRATQFLNGHRDAIIKIGAVSGAAFAALALGVKDATRESRDLNNALIGLGSIASGMGADVEKAKEAAKSLAADGLMTVADAATSLKNLLSRGFSLQESIELMNRFKDSAAFGRQASLSFGQAIRGASEGLKNENSILVNEICPAKRQLLAA